MPKGSKNPSGAWRRNLLASDHKNSVGTISGLETDLLYSICCKRYMEYLHKTHLTAKRSQDGLARARLHAKLILESTKRGCGVVGPVTPCAASETILPRTARSNKFTPVSTCAL